jgi:hypothetical protein
MLSQENGHRFSAIVFIHPKTARPNAPWLVERSLYNWPIVCQLVGEAFFSRIVFASTAWSHPPTADQTSQDTQAGSQEPFRSHVQRVNWASGPSSHGALDIIRMAIERQPRQLAIQHDLIDRRLPLGDTNVGRLVIANAKHLGEKLSGHQDERDKAVERAKQKLCEGYGENSKRSDSGGKSARKPAVPVLVPTPVLVAVPTLAPKPNLPQRATAQPKAQQAAQSIQKTALKPNPEAKPVAKPSAKPMAKPAAKPAAKPVARPAPAPPPKPTPNHSVVPKPPVRPLPKPPAQPAPKPVLGPGPALVRPTTKPTPTPSPRPIPKSVSKPVPKQVSSPAKVTTQKPLPSCPGSNARSSQGKCPFEVLYMETNLMIETQVLLVGGAAKFTPRGAHIILVLLIHNLSSTSQDPSLPRARIVRALPRTFGIRRHARMFLRILPRHPICWTTIKYSSAPLRCSRLCSRLAVHMVPIPIRSPSVMQQALSSTYSTPTLTKITVSFALRFFVFCS